MKLEKQVAIVTGGARGLGRAIAARLADEGAYLVLAAPEKDELSAVQAELSSNGCRAIGVLTDVTKGDQVQAMADATVKEFGRIDLLVNNAGIAGPTTRVDQVAPEEWNETMDVNLTGAFLCVRAVAPTMIAQGSGKIVNISSVAGKIGYALRTPYAASKWGLIGLSRSLANELGEYGIQVNAICPGPIQGDRMQRIFEGRAAALGKPVEEVRRDYLEIMALRRMVPPEDVAATVAFLASSEGENITGQALDVSAGYQL